MTAVFSIDYITQLCVVALLSGVLGLEREIHGRAARFRTHILVSLGAAVFMMLSPYLARINGDYSGDPGRIATQIVTGIGF